MKSKTYAFEDFTPGRTFALGPRLVTREEIVAFAGEFDPQPMHLDEAAGRAGLLGGLAASGWHVCAMTMRMFADAYILDSTSQGAPGVEICQWKRPALAGDTLSGASTVVGARPLESRPGLGAVAFSHDIVNQRGEIVCHMENSVFFLFRNAGESRGRS